MTEKGEMSKVNIKNFIVSRNLFSESIFTYIIRHDDDAKTEVSTSEVTFQSHRICGRRTSIKKKNTEML